MRDATGGRRVPHAGRRRRGACETAGGATPPCGRPKCTAVISGYIYGDWGTQATCGTFTLEAGMTRGCYAPSEPYRGDQLGLSGVLHVNGEFQGWNEAAPAKH
ncbi:hypothetical protein GCM10017752_67130 [Streptomyces roseoviridis]